MTEKQQAQALLEAAKEAAKANGMNLTQWAHAAGFPRQQVSRWVNGRGGISLENFVRLCGAAGAKIEIINLKNNNMTKELISTGYDQNNQVVAEKYVCTKPNCNCVGQWVEGDESEVVEWVDED